MAERVSHSTRAILNTIEQLRVLERTLRTKVRAKNAGESLRIRSVVIDASKLIAQLEGIAAKTTAASGSSIEEVKEKLAAEAQKRSSGQVKAKEDCEPVEKADGADLAGVMVALYPSKALSEQLAVEGGEPAERLHITLAYFEDKAADRDDWGRLSEIVEKVAAKHAKLSGHVAGAGRFVNEEGDVAWASFDLPGINELRQDIVEEAERAGFKISRLHSFTPHCTIAYLEKDQPFPSAVERTPASFSRAHVVTGDKRISSHPLGST